MELSIAEMLACLEVKAVGLNPADLVRPVKLCFDSRTCKSDEIFWPLVGERFDAHSFIPQVMERGALMTMANENWLQENKTSFTAYVPVKDTKEALLKLAKEYGKRFVIPKVAITGSNGKTTTKDMIKTVLAFKGEVMATEGNYNNHIGVPLTMFRLQRKHDFAVIEMGTSGLGEIKPLSIIAAPSIALITNIGYSHLEGLKDLDTVFREKLSITAGLKKGGVLVINADDERLSRLRSNSRYKLLTFGIRRGQLRPSELKWDDNGCASFRVGRTKFRLKVPGVHNLYNALAAIVIGIQLKVSKSEISKALAQYKASSLRMEVREASGFKILADCYNANPTSVSSALQTLQTMKCDGKKVAILGDMLELGEKSAELHRMVGSTISEMGFDALYTIGDAARNISDGALEKGMNSEKVRHFNDLEILQMHLQENLAAGDIYLVKASRGMRLETIANELEKVSVF